MAMAADSFVIPIKDTDSIVTSAVPRDGRCLFHILNVWRRDPDADHDDVERFAQTRRNESGYAIDPVVQEREETGAKKIADQVAEYAEMAGLEDFAVRLRKGMPPEQHELQLVLNVVAMNLTILQPFADSNEGFIDQWRCGKPNAETAFAILTMPADAQGHMTEHYDLWVNGQQAMANYYEAEGTMTPPQQWLATQHRDAEVAQPECTAAADAEVAQQEYTAIADAEVTEQECTATADARSRSPLGPLRERVLRRLHAHHDLLQSSPLPIAQIAAGGAQIAAGASGDVTPQLNSPRPSPDSPNRTPQQH